MPFSFRARAEKGIARHIDASTQRGWDLVIFDWFVLSMRMQVILDSSFARPGSAPIWGGKKGEFRDWTTLSSFLKIGMIFAIFNLFGYTPVEIEIADNIRRELQYLRWT